MKKTVLILVIALGIILLYLQNMRINITTADQAIALVKKTYPIYKDYPSDNLPLKTVEAVATQEGWRVGMYVEGSGVRGILKAECFLVTRAGEVSQTGFFSGEGPARSINVSTCTPTE